MTACKVYACSCHRRRYHARPLGEHNYFEECSDAAGLLSAFYLHLQRLIKTVAVLDLSTVPHKVVGLLLGANAEVDARDKQQRTPLHLCSETGHEVVVKVRDQLVRSHGAVDSALVQVTT